MDANHLMGEEHQRRVVLLLRAMDIWDLMAQRSKRGKVALQFWPCGCCTARNLLGGTMVPLHCEDSAAKSNGKVKHLTACWRPRVPMIHVFPVRGRVLGPTDLRAV